MTMRRIRAAAALCAAAALLAVPAARADDAPAERKAFRVCQDPNNLPFSNTAAEGFENKIAELLAKDLGLPVTYYSFPQRLAFIRNTLRYKLPGEDYRCDIVMGVPAGFDQVSATKPYYASTYAMVIPKGTGLDGVKSQADLLALPKDRLGKLRIGLFDRSPVSEWLAQHNLVEQGVPYPIMSPDPAQYPGELIERELAGGRIDMAIVWGPIAGFYARRVKTPELMVVPMTSEKHVKFEFPMAMGVRYGEPEWKKQIESLLEKRRDDILAILRDYGVPIVTPAAEPGAAAAK